MARKTETIWQAFVRWCGWLAIAALVLGMAVPMAFAAPEENGESLDKSLLDDLSAGLFDEGLLEPDQPQGDESPHQLPVIDGEDLGAGPGTATLQRVRHHMGKAKSLIESRDTSDQTRQLQEQVIEDLDALIAQLNKQCQGACNKPGSQPKPGSSRKMSSQGMRAAADSTDRLDQRAAKSVQTTNVEELIKDVWGHLPQRTREELLQSSTLEFLPKYQLEIEQYFRRLAEEQSQPPADGQ